MAKETKNGNGNKTRTLLYILSLVLSAAIAATAVIAYAVNNTHETEDTVKAVKELKVEGCLPSRANEKDLIRFEGKVDAVIKEQKASKIEKKESEARIIKAIQEKE